MRPTIGTQLVQGWTVVCQGRPWKAITFLPGAKAGMHSQGSVDSAPWHRLDQPSR
ncbi:hypothetical protein THTE_2317 [Thermogutta terrifontis]|uniref:Uncharacterized protein n=1 Tax=Thermogutta terrifontis TaxID=1331910 RepID=A0A286RG23_9BACT|nr:hypothetical protein THTE_2317 [Thermogutta terrifontis]